MTTCVLLRFAGNAVGFCALVVATYLTLPYLAAVIYILCILAGLV